MCEFLCCVGLWDSIVHCVLIIHFGWIWIRIDKRLRSVTLCGGYAGGPALQVVALIPSRTITLSIAHSDGFIACDEICKFRRISAQVSEGVYVASDLYCRLIRLKDLPTVSLGHCGDALSSLGASGRSSSVLLALCCVVGADDLVPVRVHERHRVVQRVTVEVPGLRVPVVGIGR